MGFHNTVLRASLALLMLAGTATAATGQRDPLVEGARLCTQQFPTQERMQNIPNHLLAAISSTESGRWHKGLGMALPWPWTANVEGKGYYYNSKAEAIAGVQQHMRNGARSIDVGCMQVNLKHHAKAFANLSEAFEPANNVAYAAKFLRTNYNDLGDWIKATGAYHSRTPKYGNAYLARIEKSWNRIVSKVATARANQGLAPQATARPDFTVADNAVPKASTRPMNRIEATRGVKSIKVSQQQRRASEVMIVRAETKNGTIRVADAMATNANALPVTRQNGVSVVGSAGVDSAAPSANSAQPKFVFAN